MIATRDDLIKYTALVCIAAVLAFLVHAGLLFFLEQPIFQHFIIWSYLANALIASAIVIGILRAPAKYQNSLGFLFMGSSMFKFAVFFIFFYPAYKADGTLTKFEFLTFFVPYAVCLTAETSVLINRLNRA